MARKILLADDSVTAQNMGRRILTDAGYEVTTVNNGSAALKRIAESKPDLIVLDVYMPGYGGLEVCQRIRESEDTARIPVLLTVGKLEPFKAEDARRVRADAYVVKPFEASELLTALTKLEDKIVPPPQPQKPGRSIPPAAAIERMSAGKSFGDAETGWKNRLTIPAPHLKSQEEHIGDSETRVEPVRPAGRDIPPPERAPERNVSPGMGDITPDEIAAIAAAAAAFSTPNEEPFVKPVWEVEEKPAAAVEDTPVAARGPEPEPVPESADVEAGATFASAPEVSAGAGEEPPATEMAAAPAVPAEIPPAETEAPTDLTAEQPAVEIPPASLEPVSAAIDEGKLKHEEVAAALASLAPIPSAPLPDNATMAVAASGQQLTGPRWVAEAVPLSDDEAALILEQEMIKAQAAMAEMSAVPAAEAAAEFAVASQESSPVPEIESASFPVPSAGESARQASEVQEVPTPAIIEEALADAVALHAETQSEQPAPEVEQEAAFAASAAAGGFVESVTVDATSHTFAPTEMSAPAAEPVAQRESELAAAWASWKQVRDSVGNPEFTSQIADAAASLSEAPASEPAPSPESAAAPEAHPPEETGAIASIVDSVLAELKPKLMEEIAKKIKKDK